MWPFEKKYSITGTGLLKGWTDWHSHILPGVDDGIPTMDDSLKVLDYYEQAGVSEVWLTPHIMEDVPNDTKKLRARYKELQAAYNGPIQLYLAAENMIDRLFDQRLSDNDLLPLPDSCLLVETSYFNPPLDLWDILKEIRSMGYWPVLAHPERYVYMTTQDYQKLIQMDVQLQLNLPSVCGLYGREARHKAFWLLKKGYYNRCGSDLHRLGIIRRAYDNENIPKKIIEKVEGLISR